MLLLPIESFNGIMRQLKQSYTEMLSRNIEKFQSIAESILSTDICQGIDSFSNELYSCAFDVYGLVRRISKKKHTSTRKFTSPWFNNDCELARRKFRKASRIFAKNKCENNRL